MRSRSASIVSSPQFCGLVGGVALRPPAGSELLRLRDPVVTDRPALEAGQPGIDPGELGGRSRRQPGRIARCPPRCASGRARDLDAPDQLEIVALATASRVQQLGRSIRLRVGRRFGPVSRSLDRRLALADVPLLGGRVAEASVLRSTGRLVRRGIGLGRAGASASEAGAVLTSDEAGLGRRGGSLGFRLALGLGFGLLAGDLDRGLFALPGDALLTVASADHRARVQRRILQGIGASHAARSEVRPTCEPIFTGRP